MHDRQIAPHIGLLKSADPHVRRSSAQALQSIGDVSAVPALIAALKDANSGVGFCALQALLHMDEAVAVSALIEALRGAGNLVCLSPTVAWDSVGADSLVEALLQSLMDTRDQPNHRVRERAAAVLATLGVAAVPGLVRVQKRGDRDARARASRVLRALGNSSTLPRKILAASQFTAQERISILETLRRVRDYKFEDTRTLCHAILQGENDEAHPNALVVLLWLDGHRELLLASIPGSPAGSKNLLVAHQSETADPRPETLLMPSSKPVKNIPLTPPQSSLWQRWIGKRK